MKDNSLIQLLNACDVKSENNTLRNLITILIAQRDEARGALISAIIIKDHAIKRLIENPNDLEAIERAIKAYRMKF